MWRNRRGQLTAELAVLFTFVIAAFVFAGFYLQRGVQGSMRSNADSLGQQFSVKTGGWDAFSSQTSVTTKENKTGSVSCSDYSHKVDGGAGVPITNCVTPVTVPTGDVTSEAALK